MQISVNEVEYCKLNIKYQADPETVKDKRHFVAKEMSKTYEAKGFRKGKAPPEAIRISFPKEVDGHLKQEMLNEAFKDVTTEKGIKPFGGPQVDSVNLNGNSFDCEFSIHTLPDFELKEYKGFDLPKPNVGVTEDDLSQQIMEQARKEHGEAVPYKEGDFVQEGDSIVVQYKSFIGDQPIERLSSEGTVLEVGKINVVGFDANVMGMKPDEERTFTLKTPIDFDPEYAEKELTFNVKLISGSKQVPAALDDELAKKLGLENFEALNVQVKGLASAKIQGMENGHYQDQISRRLIADHDFKIPEWISLPEAKIQAQMQKKKWDDLSEEEKQKLIKDSEDGIKLSLILEKIKDNEPDAQLSNEELIELAKKNIGQYTSNPEVAMEDIYKQGQMSMLLSRVKDEFTLGFIQRNCNIIE